MPSTEDPKGVETPTSDSLSGNGHNDDPYSYAGVTEAGALTMTPSAPARTAKAGGGGGKLPPPPPSGDSEDEDDGMLRMSFLEHLEELRSRILRMLAGLGIAFVGSLWFCNNLWLFVQQPPETPLRKLGMNPPTLVPIHPIDPFHLILLTLPFL